MGDGDRKHRVTVVAQGVAIDGWISYSIQTSMIEAAQSFTLTRPFRLDAWKILRCDARITVVLDGTTVITGLIDKREHDKGENTITISGRCLVGRLVQESALALNYAKLTMIEAVKRLADPFFTTVSTSGARDRKLRRGKGRKVVDGVEPLIINLPVPKRGAAHPGSSRWAIIEDIVSQAGYLCWGSADGKELIVGSPNSQQSPQYLFRHASASSGSKGNVRSMKFVEDQGDQYSLIAVVGTGGGDDANYGVNVQRAGRALDFDSADGTGGGFLVPKRLLMPERDYDKNKDATRAAEREFARREFSRYRYTIQMSDHGQFIGSEVRTIYAFNTIARVIDEDLRTDESWLIYAVSFECDGKAGETSTIELVPDFTEIIQ